MPAGRPTLYKDNMPERAYKLCVELGATDEQLATAFGVDERTINNWKEEHPEFLQSIKKGKDDFDSGRVEKSLLHRALGYSHPEDKVFNDNGEPLIVPTTKHYPPDPVSAIFWLKNRQPGRWRDKTEQEINGNLTIETVSYANKNPA